MHNRCTIGFASFAGLPVGKTPGATVKKSFVIVLCPVPLPDFLLDCADFSANLADLELVLTNISSGFAKIRGVEFVVSGAEGVNVFS